MESKIYTIRISTDKCLDEPHRSVAWHLRNLARIMEDQQTIPTSSHIQNESGTTIGLARISNVQVNEPVYYA